VNVYEVAARLLAEEGSSPLFRTPVRSTPDDVEMQESSYPIAPESDPSYGGPVALLVGPITVSAAENFATILVDAERVTVVGRPSAGTNGNITGVQLPGAFALTFTGMEVLFPDGGRFHGVGIQPDVLVTPTPADIRDGVDPVLLAALDTFQD
jgi:C-terminal processing protease CtpA/Prc